MLCLVPGSPVQERHSHAGYSPTKGYKIDYGIGASLLWENIERAGILQFKEEKVQECLVNVCIFLKGWYKADRAVLFVGVHWHDKKQWVLSETQEASSEHWEAHFYCDSDWALAGGFDKMTCGCPLQPQQFFDSVNSKGLLKRAKKILARIPLQWVVRSILSQELLGRIICLLYNVSMLPKYGAYTNTSACQQLRNYVLLWHGMALNLIQSLSLIFFASFISWYSRQKRSYLCLPEILSLHWKSSAASFCSCLAIVHRYAAC